MPVSKPEIRACSISTLEGPPRAARTITPISGVTPVAPPDSATMLTCSSFAEPPAVGVISTPVEAALIIAPWMLTVAPSATTAGS